MPESDKYFLTPVPLFLSEKSRGPTTACVTLSNAVSNVIQHLKLTDRRIILIIARFVTMQSSRPLYMSKQVKSLSERAEARVFLFLIYVICHHMLQLIKIRAELFYIQASFCNKSNLPFCFLHKKKQMFIIYRSFTHSIMSILKLRSLS